MRMVLGRSAAAQCSRRVGPWDYMVRLQADLGLSVSTDVIALHVFQEQCNSNSIKNCYSKCCKSPVYVLRSFLISSCTPKQEGFDGAHQSRKRSAIATGHG